jgi:hypothetical protein
LLIYIATEHSFDTIPVSAVFASILVNDLNIEISNECLILSIWGMSPYVAWKEASLTPPTAEYGDVVVVTDHPLNRGESWRLNESHRWPVFVDAASGWVHVDGGGLNARVVSPFLGAVLEIDEAGNLHGIWLKPEELPKLNGGRNPEAGG